MPGGLAEEETRLVAKWETRTVDHRERPTTLNRSLRR
jgi:hypothetical protein